MSSKQLARIMPRTVLIRQNAFSGKKELIKSMNRSDRKIKSWFLQRIFSKIKKKLK
jgi:hypothetical protein